MRCLSRSLGCCALALALVPFGMAQSQTSAPPDPGPSQDPSAGSPPPVPEKAEKAEKTAPPPSSWNNIEAIGNRNVGCDKGVGNWYSLDKQVAMGRAYSQQVEHGAKMVQDPVVTEYINRLGQNLVRNSDAKVPFTIKVIDTDEINAFALPGDSSM